MVLRWLSGALDEFFSGLALGGECISDDNKINTFSRGENAILLDLGFTRKRYLSLLLVLPKHLSICISARLILVKARITETN